MTWDERRGVLSGTEHVRLTHTGPGLLRRVWFRLWPNGWRPVGSRARPAGCRAPRMTVTVARGGRAGRRAVDCSALEVVLVQPVRAGRSTSLTLRFRVRVPRAEDRFGRLPNGTTMLGNAVPVLAVTDEDGTDLPPYSSVGESFHSLAARWDLRLRLPPGIDAATTGTTSSRRRTAGGTVLRAGTPRARDLALAVGRFRVASTLAGDVRVRVFRPAEGPPSAAGAARVGALARRALLELGRRYGPYGAREYDVVVAPFRTFGGMEYPELALTTTDPASVVHETAHQWWYGIVGNDQRDEPWLDESFATFSHLRVLGGLEGCDRDDPLGRTWGAGRLDASMDEFDANPARLGRIYLGGACALESLRRDWGTARFDRLLRAFVDDHRFGVATTAGFVAAVRRAAPPGYDVDAWLRRARLV